MGSQYSIPGVVQWYRQGKRYYGAAGFEGAKKTWLASDFPATLEGQCHVVTGANSGLGFQVARGLASRHASVHLLCRNQQRGEEAVRLIRTETGNENVHLHVCDVSSPVAVRAFATEWQSAGRPAISSLVLNAGNLNQQRQMTPDGTMEASWATAMCQSYLMTGLMLPSLHASDARVIHVSSGGGLTVRCDLEDPFAERRTYDGTVQYAIAKRTQIELADEWSHRLASRPGLLMASMHPGWAVTEGVLSSIPDFAASNEGKLRTPEQGIDTIMWLAAASRDAILRQAAASDEKPVSGLNAAPGSGLFWFDRAPAQKHFWLASTSISNEERKGVWAMCEKLFGWTYQA